MGTRQLPRWQDHLAAFDGSADFAQHRATFQAFAEAWPDDEGPPPAWLPTPERVQSSNLHALWREQGLDGYEELHAWSVRARGAFWGRVAAHYGFTWPGDVLGEGTAGGASDGQRVDRNNQRLAVEDPDWFPGARWNVVDACFRADPDAIAVVSSDEDGASRTCTYRQLKALADQVSHGLVAKGLQQGDAVALYMPMDVACVAAYLGIVQAGLVVVSIADSFAPEEVRQRLRLADAKAMVTVAAFRRGGKDIPMLEKAREALAGGRERLLVVIDPAPGALEEGECAWDDLLVDDGPFQPVPLPVQHASNILFSSGTTGEPKAIPWTHLTPLKAAMDGRYHQDIHNGDVVAWPTNIGWMMGPWLVYATMMNGATMALFHGAPTGPAFLEAVRRHRVSMLGVVPALVKAWRQAGIPPGSLPDVRTFSSTGEASDPDDQLYLMSLADHQAPVIEYCGGTEIGGGHVTGTVVQPQSPATFSTPALGIDFVCLDEEGASVRAGQMGELFLLPPSIGLSQRLLNRDHHEVYHAGCPPGPGGEVLRRHGDQMQRLGRGYWRAQGRADDTMNLGGIKVGSVELETAMNTVEGVLETAAIGVPPSGGGADRLVVFAVPRPGSDPQATALRAAFQDVLKARLNPLFRVHEVVVVEALPRTASNKVMRRVLRRRYEER